MRTKVVLGIIGIEIRTKVDNMALLVEPKNEYDNVRVKRKVLQGLQDIHRQYNPGRTLAGLAVYGQPDT